jgi:SpoVK/Ycf46/Vps4 family AAA+-type ATPase
VPVVLLFDVVDSVGVARGESLNRANDRVLQSFMAELDGFPPRGNVLVIAATNREDAIDPALLRPGRLGDLVLRVPRPGRRAAGQILGKHLHPEMPYRAAEGGAEAARAAMIEAAVAAIYGPQAETELATVVFRDGSRHAVRRADLVSGAVLAKLADAAAERALVRELEGGDAGLCVHDILDAAADEFDLAAGNLTPANCRRHLDSLPQDLDVVRVEPVVRRVARAHRYLTLSVA